MSDTVDNARVGHGLRDDVCQVEVEEVYAVSDAAVLTCLSDLDKDDKDDGNEQEEGCDEGPNLACSRGSFDLRFGRIFMTWGQGTVCLARWRSPIETIDILLLASEHCGRGVVGIKVCMNTG